MQKKDQSTHGDPRAKLRLISVGQILPVLEKRTRASDEALSFVPKKEFFRLKFPSKMSRHRSESIQFLWKSLFKSARHRVPICFGFNPARQPPACPRQKTTVQLLTATLVSPLWTPVVGRTASGGTNCWSCLLLEAG